MDLFYKREPFFFATGIENEEFNAFNGWLETFRKRQNITVVTRTGEYGDAPEDDVKA